MIFPFRPFITSIVCLAVLALMPAAAQAVDTPCDPAYYRSLESRAWMEAQREIEQNQNLIFKADSVLEYTCFNKFGDELAAHAKDLFSESTKWGTVNPVGSMGTALTTLVGTSMHSYLDTNFNHKYLGGRGKDDYLTLSGFTGTISAGSYTCSEMAKVWQQDAKTAKCYNFIPSGEDDDGFFTFKDYQDKTSAVRRYPVACPVNSKWATENSRALGKYVGGNDDLLGQSDSVSTGWKRDTEFEYLDITKDCGSSPVVKTGLKLPSGGDEYVCLIPGCYHNGSACASAAATPSP